MRKTMFMLPLLFTTGSALAQDSQPRFSDLDRDGDGVITREEAERHSVLAERFEEADLNRDGSIDRAEYARNRGPQDV